MEIRERGAYTLEALTILNRTASSVPNEEHNRLLTFFRRTDAKDFSWKPCYLQSTGSEKKEHWWRSMVSL